jgi:lipoyl-dependent peroxiredoxin
MQWALCTDQNLLKDPSQIELRNQTRHTSKGDFHDPQGEGSFKTRFENEKGTNPEELIAAAHAGCFTMALAFGLQGAGFTPTELSTEAAVTLEPEGQGFRISRSALTLRAKVPNIDETKFAQVAKDACWTPSWSKRRICALFRQSGQSSGD